MAAIRTEPRSFNRFVSRDATTEVLTFLTQTSLVKVNRVSGDVEPELAESWALLPDQRTYRLHLREGVRFSDGEPFSSADVLFSFDALYDEHGGTVLGDSIKVSNQPLRVRAEDAHTVLVTFPAVFGPGLRLLDGLPILPRHRLSQALGEGRFSAVWGPATSPKDVVGLGPFVLESVEAGQWLSFRRNPEYVGAGTRRHGRAPDRITLRVVSDQSAELLLLESGDLDLASASLPPSDYGALVGDRNRDRVRLTDLGVAFDGDMLWFNLTAARARDARSSWLQHPTFRQAISHAVDRGAFVDLVYLGAAVPSCGVVSPGNRDWHVGTGSCDVNLNEARRLLATLGLVDVDGDGTLDQPHVGPARFTLLTQRGNTSLERGAAALRDSLAAIGVRVDVVAMDVPLLVDRITKGDYDAAYFKLLTTDSDPALNLDFWLSSGSAHVWNPGQQAPATAWERRVDDLMASVAASYDESRRRESFAEVQRIMAREQPVLVFAFPRLWIATSARVARAEAAVLRPHLLWNPLTIEMRDATQ